jgi:hypothetical protein
MSEDASASAPERPTNDDPDAWRAYWKGQGIPWRTDPKISADRQAYLAERRAITPDIEHGVYPFKDIEPTLTRADIEWLLKTHQSRGAVGPVVWEEEKDKPEAEQRTGLDLRGSSMSHLDLRHLPLARLIASLTLHEWTNATDAQLQQASAQLEGADLRGAQLEGAHLLLAQLEGADLRLAFFDHSTALNDVILGTEEAGFVNVADARWGGVNLAVVDWAPLLAGGLGDEGASRQWKPSTPDAGADDTPRSRKQRAQARQARKTQQAAERLQLFQAAVRANRELATELRSQGMNEEADQLAYRAQVLQRQVFRQQGMLGRALL